MRYYELKAVQGPGVIVEILLTMVAQPIFFELAQRQDL
jgi:hypothetical protein